MYIPYLSLSRCIELMGRNNTFYTIYIYIVHYVYRLVCTYGIRRMYDIIRMYDIARMLTYILLMYACRILHYTIVYIMNYHDISCINTYTYD